MRQYLTPDDLFSYVLMLRAAERRAVMLVEGDSDHATLEDLINSAEVNVIPGHGKENVKGAITRCNDHDMPMVIALLDQDWVGLLEAPISAKNVFYTDFYDIDATVFFSGNSAQRVAANFGERQKLTAFLARVNCDSIAQWSLNIALPIGVLRFISEKEGLQLNLNDFPIGETLVGGSSSVSIEKLVSIAYGRSTHPSLSKDDIRELLQMEIAVLGGDSRRFCSGHDLAKALTVALQKQGGASEGFKTIEKALRASLSAPGLKETKLHATIRLWGQDNEVKAWAFE